MKRSPSTAYALRSLARHPRRTILSVAGIGVGCSVCLLLVSFTRGEGQTMVRAAAESGIGHLRIVPGPWVDTRKNELRLPGWSEILERVRDAEFVKLAVPRARTEALLGFGTRVAGVEIVGVDAAREQGGNRLVRAISHGTYLATGAQGTVVVGAGVARRLDVAVDDELMVTASGRDGELRSAMLRIVGIVTTGSGELDASLCHVNLDEVERLTGYAGAGEIAVFLRDPRRLEGDAVALRALVPASAAVITWADLIPELAAAVKVDRTWAILIICLIVVVVVLGITSAQLAAVLERRREFGLLAALGMRGSRLARLLVVESLALGLAGAAVALAIGVPGAYLMATRGIDFRAVYGDLDLAMSNILLDPVVYGDMGWWLLPLAVGLAAAATAASMLYPAWYAIRTAPAIALRADR